MAKRKKTIIAGKMVITVISSMMYPSDNAQIRADKRRASDEARKRLNLKSSCANLEMLLHTNFRTGDLFLTLTYHDEYLPKTRTQAKHILNKYIRKVRRYCKDIKYIKVTEGLHGDKRVHHHLVVSSAELDVIKSLWTYGHSKSKIINENQFIDLARYLTKEPRDGIALNSGRCWSASRNMLRPLIKSEIIPDNLHFDIPVGATKIEKELSENGWGEFAYYKYKVQDNNSDDAFKRKRKTS